MRVLIAGDMARTGFGTVTTDLGRALLAREGLDCRFLSLNEGEDQLAEPFASRTAIIGGPDGWLATTDDPESILRTTERIQTMYQGGLFADGWAPEAGLIIGDMGSLAGSPIVTVAPDSFPLYNYVPIEGVDLAPRWGIPWTKATPVAMSEFGADEIAKIMGVRPPVVYHGVDTEVFRQASPMRPLMVQGKLIRSREEAKAFFGMDPARTMILRTDRNMPRKNYPSLLRCIAPVLAAHPDVDLVMHCAPRDLGGDLDDERSKYHPEVATRMHTTKLPDRPWQPWPREMLVALYNAADLYVSNSPEGFGLTVAEALACGVPAVGLGFSAVPEVIGPAGTVVRIGKLIDSPYAQFWALPDEPQYTEAVEFLVTHKHRREQLGMLGPMHVKSKFQWTHAAEQFAGILNGARLEAVA